MPEKKSRFLLELNEMPNRGGRVATDFVRLFNFQCIKTTFSSSSTAQLIYPRFHSNLRTKPDFWVMPVNGSEFVKCSTCSISTSRRDYGQSAVLELFVRNQAKISLKITDKVPFFADLSVSKTHFTDKPAFSNDLSVNFWPL